MAPSHGSDYEVVAREVFRRCGKDMAVMLDTTGRYPSVISGDRKLEFGPKGIFYGRTDYLHTHGMFSLHGGINSAIAFLRNKQDLPPSTAELIKKIVSGLRAAGAVFSVDVQDPWCPIIRNASLKREILFGLFGANTVNCYEKGVDQGLTDVAGAIRWLTGLWYNK